ncbi:glycosyltransferase family 4 protein [Sphingomonas sp.]|uniref:glycosyltransferase family 4 protein n=1 Tax=Sphingomonas sp. TaxID=28214 RepID=UPI001AFED8A6|nr:glycosyltransferase family 4 protein [Sphingomonas sp.]MBO9711496.1 glycosyltransferase family 4 protein [Sphingomonas sp.]
MSRPATFLILVTDAYGGFGGISQYNRDLIDGLCSLDEVGRVDALPRIAKEPVGELPAKLHFDLSGIAGKPAYALAVLRHAFSGPRPDLVLCGHLNLLPLAALVAGLRRAKLALQIHGIDAWTPHPGALVRWLTGRIDVVLSVSAVTADRYLKWARPPRTGARVLPNTITLERYGVAPKAPDLVEKFGLAGRTVLLTMGRLAGRERYKGFDRVIEAMPLIAAHDPSAVYVVAGAGDDLERLRDKAKQFGVGDRVIFTGFVPEERKADYFRLADVYVMPSLGEGFGIVCLEAMACGVPTVASTRDGSFEAIRGGELGIAVDPFDPTAIKDAVAESLRRPRTVPSGLNYFAVPAFRARLRELFFGTDSIFCTRLHTKNSVPDQPGAAGGID